MFKFLGFSKKECLTYVILLLSSFQPAFLAVMIDRTIQMATDRDVSNLFPTFLTATAGLFFFFLVGVLAYRLKHEVIRQKNIILKSKVTEQFMAADLSSKKCLPNLPSFLVTDLKLVEEKGIDLEFTMVQQLFIFVISLGFSLIFDGWTTLFFFMGTFLAALSSMLQQEKIEELTKEWSDNNEKFTEVLGELVDNKLIIHMTNSATTFQELFSNQLRRLEDSLFERNFFVDRKNELIMFIALTLSALAPFSMGAYRISTGHLSMAGFLAIVQLSNSLVNPVLILIQSLNERAMATSVMETVRQLNLATPQESSDKDSFSDEIELSMVLPNNQSIHLELKPSEKVLIKGATGIGKSSLFKNLLRREHTALNYKIDNKDIDYDRLQNNLYAYLPQEQGIFKATLQFNLSLGHDYSEDEIQSVLELVELQDFVAKNGMEYLIEKHGSNISGGEMKRILLARALLENKQVLLMDEFNASLDSDTALRIQQRLSKLADKTIVQIAHNTSEGYERTFDRVIVLK